MGHRVRQQLARPPERIVPPVRAGDDPPRLFGEGVE